KRSVQRLPVSLSRACGFLRRFTVFFTDYDANSFRQCATVRFLFAAIAALWTFFRAAFLFGRCHCCSTSNDCACACGQLSWPLGSDRLWCVAVQRNVPDATTRGAMRPNAVRACAPFLRRASVFGTVFVATRFSAKHVRLAFLFWLTLV